MCGSGSHPIAAMWMSGRLGGMPRRCLGLGEFPTLSLWITQVRGYKFCDGIVKRLRAEVRM
nr:MAG TPA: hypothetical protein [Caudoviricetes sp.]